MKACPMYETKVKSPAPAPPENHLWCLRCGTSEHATVRCPTNDPPVNFPPDGDTTSRGCLFCGIFGHDMKECLRRVPQVQTEQAARLTALASDHDSQATAIKQLQSDVKALQASHSIITECKEDLALLNSKVNTLMSFKETVEPKIAASEKLGTSFQQFLDRDWQPHRRRFQAFLDDEWPPVKRQFEELLQRDLDSVPPRSRNDTVTIDSSPELPGPPDDETMSPARTTGAKRPTTARSEPPTTPAKKRLSSEGTSRRWWADLEPLSVDQAPKAWHKDLLEALLSMWSDNNMIRLQHWVSAHASEEMRVTLDTLSTANTTTRQLHSGLRTLLRGARVPPLIFSAHPPKGRSTAASSSLNDLGKNRH